MFPGDCYELFGNPPKQYIAPAPWPTGRNDTEKDGPTDHGKATQAEIDAHNFRIEEGGRGL